MNDFLNKNGGIVTLAKASIVPIGLYAFSKYNEYDTKKTIKVTIIGSVVIFSAIVINEFSGWSGQDRKLSNRLLYALNIKTKPGGIKNVTNNSSEVLVGNKPIPVTKNMAITQKKCLKWNQPTCITAPCPAQCEQYEK
jgi:hypothetical protein